MCLSLEIDIPVCFGELLNHLLTICLLILHISKWGTQGKNPLELPVYQPGTDAYHTAKDLVVLGIHAPLSAVVRAGQTVGRSIEVGCVHSLPGQYLFIFLRTTHCFLTNPSPLKVQQRRTVSQ